MLRMSLFAVGLLALVLAGCAAPAGPDANGDPLAAAPDDFALEVAVLAGAEAAGRPEAHLRPSRFILLADGSLHYAPADSEAAPELLDGGRDGRASDAGQAARAARSDGPANWLPPLTRVLDRGEVAALWSRARQLGFIGSDDAPAAGAVNIATIVPAADEIVHVATFRASGCRWSIVRSAAGETAPDAAMTELIRTLAGLAWASDAPDPQSRTVPKRYDFGPDPYARYRQ